MRIQLLSDLHLETEDFDPEPNPAAELLVLGGDIDSSWEALQRFRGWPAPVLMVAGNHEFDGRDVDEAWPALRARCDELGIRLLERESCVLVDGDGARIRFTATVRWCDFDLFGESGRATAMRAAAYYMRIMRSSRRGVAFDPEGVREEALACRDWLAAELAKAGDWDRTVVLTHFAPSLRSADPRYGAQPGTASFCNADDALLPHAATWIHGHLHCRHDYLAQHDGGRTRVVCNARGHVRKGEAEGHDPLRIFDV